jgi:hypothetical protein
MGIQLIVMCFCITLCSGQVFPDSKLSFFPLLPDLNRYCNSGAVDYCNNLLDNDRYPFSFRGSLNNLIVASTRTYSFGTVAPSVHSPNNYRDDPHFVLFNIATTVADRPYC